MTAHELTDLLLDSKPVTPERLASLHSKLYQQADKLIHQHDPCEVRSDKGVTTCHGCRSSHRRWGEPDTLCCRGCKHHDPAAGCKAEEPATCKTWLCPGSKDMPSDREDCLHDIQNRLGKARLYTARGDKTTSVKSAVDWWTRNRKAREERQHQQEQWKHEQQQRIEMGLHTMDFVEWLGQR